MTNNKIDSVKIIHDELCGEEYRVLSDFLRLVGIFVCNATYQDNRLDDDKFDFVVYIKNKNSSDENLTKLSSILDKKLCVISGHNFSEEGGNPIYREDILKQIFQSIRTGDNYLMGDDIDDWNQLSDLFIKYDFVKARRFVYFRDASEYAQEAKNVFLKMVTELTDLQTAGRKSRYIDYAFLHLAYLINECCSYLKQNFTFDSKKLYELMKKSAIEYNDFENHYLLMAFLAELDPVLTLNAESCYQNAAFKLESFSYANYAYYRYGRFCEISLKDDQKAREYYYKAYRVNPKEFRAIYKLGYYALLDKQLGEAAQRFRTILKLLEKKYKANVLQEIEYEYYYKSCKILENIGRKTWNRQMVQRYSLESRKVLQKTEISNNHPNRSYSFLFGDESEERLQNTQRRLMGRNLGYSLLKVQSILDS